MAPSSMRSNTSIATKEVEELKTKLQTLETKRLEDRERMSDYEQIKTERERLQMTTASLTTKLNDTQNRTE